jgi:hypothetical protein
VIVDEDEQVAALGSTVVHAVQSSAAALRYVPEAQAVILPPAQVVACESNRVQATQVLVEGELTKPAGHTDGHKPLER